MTRRSSTPLLAGLEPPVPPRDLRDTVLRAARQALVLESRPDAWTLLLRSPAARIAWGTAVLALAAAHALLPAGPRPPAQGAARLVPFPADPEVAAIERLPRIDERLLPSLKGA